MKYITTGQAARRCGVGINTIKRWIQKGKLKCVMTPGGHWRIAEDDFQAFFQTLQVDAGMPEPVYKVLLIEDDREMCDLIEGAFELADFKTQFTCVQDGYQGLIQVGAMQPDLILLDIMLPEMNGLELMQRMRTSDLCRSAKILVITGAGDRRLVRQGLDKAAPDAVFFKPFDIEHLMKVSCELLQKQACSARA